MDESIWNILHDGSIEGLEGKIPGTVFVKIEIEYLAQMFSKSFKSLSVELEGCSLFEYYKDYGSIGTSDFQEIVNAKPWITSGEIKEGAMTIYCKDGFFRTEYKSILLYLEDQSPISIQQLDEKAKIYWDNFGKDSLKDS